MRIPKIDSWEYVWVLNEIIPTAPIQVDRQLRKLVSLIKAKHCRRLLDRCRMRFGMGPVRYPARDSNLVFSTEISA
jgi:hypothetical protein